MTIGQRIAQKRKEQGFSQEVLGEKLRVSRQSVYKWESDAAVPEIDKLIAMSRLFEVTVGWLLGVEEDAVRQENSPEEERADTGAAEEKRAPADNGELTEAQLKMVREIVDRYIAAQPQPPKRRRWPRILGACAVIALVWALVDLSGELDRLNSRYNNLSNAVNNVSNSVNSQIGGIADRVEEILQSQNSLLAEYSVEIVGADLSRSELLLAAEATPKTYTEGMVALFVVDTGSGPVEYPAVEEPGHQFAADITCELTDITSVSVVFVTGEKRETQVLYTQSYLLNSTFPDISVEDHFLMWREAGEDGTLTFRNEYVHLRNDESTAAINTVVPVAEISEIKVGLFKNRELVTWLTPYEGIPDNFLGFDEDAQFYRMPDMEVKVDKDDVLCMAALVTDNYGRERLYREMAYALDDNNELFWADDKIEDKEYWYNDGAWSY